MRRPPALGVALLLVAAAPASAEVLEPLWSFTKVGLESAGKAGVGAAPYGKGALAVYKVVDFGRNVGEAGLKREDRIQNQELLLIKAHASILKGLHAQGVDLNADPRAIASKEALRRIGAVMSADGLTSIQYLEAIVSRHLGYAVARAGFDETVKEVLKRLLEMTGIAKLVASWLPAKAAAGWVDGRSRFQPILQTLKWSRFADRESAANLMAADWTAKMHEKAAEKAFDAVLGHASEDLFDRVYDTLVESEPLQPIAPARVRLALTRFDLPMPAPLAVQPAAPAAAVPAVPVAVVVAQPAAVHIEPVQQVLATEDRQVQAYWAPRRESAPTAPPSEPEIRPPPEERQPTQRELDLHHELMCVGAGAKPGCGNWDGEQGKTLNDR